MKTAFVILVACAIAVVALDVTAGRADGNMQLIGGEELAQLRGGDCGTDCYTQATGCNTENGCFFASACTLGVEVCDDEAENKLCSFESNWDVFDCVVDAAHTCSPMKAQTGDCGWLSLGYCTLGAANLGPCGQTVTQCHN